MHADLQKLDTAVTKALHGLDARATQATSYARPDKWSIQQIVEHLLNTYRGSIPAIVARVEKRSATRAKPTFRQRAGQFFIITLGRFPGGRVAPAAVSPTLPTTVQSGDELAARVSAELHKLDEVTARGEHLFGDRRAVAHIILGPLSMHQWRRFHLIHGLHHLKQVAAIRREHSI
jgi:hypothetical protein